MTKLVSTPAAQGNLSEDLVEAVSMIGDTKTRLALLKEMRDAGNAVSVALGNRIADALDAEVGKRIQVLGGEAGDTLQAMQARFATELGALAADERAMQVLPEDRSEQMAFEAVVRHGMHEESANLGHRLTAVERDIFTEMEQEATAGEGGTDDQIAKIREGLRQDAENDAN